MNKIGFDPNGQNEDSSDQTGTIEDYQESPQSEWGCYLHSVISSLFHFAMIYGFYASIRDLITSLF